MDRAVHVKQVVNELRPCAKEIVRAFNSVRGNFPEISWVVFVCDVHDQVGYTIYADHLTARGRTPSPPGPRPPRGHTFEHFAVSQDEAVGMIRAHFPDGLVLTPLGPDEFYLYIIGFGLGVPIVLHTRAYSPYELN
jgi:hypothetical protein